MRILKYVIYRGDTDDIDTMERIEFVAPEIMQPRSWIGIVKAAKNKTGRALYQIAAQIVKDNPDIQILEVGSDCNPDWL